LKICLTFCLEIEQTLDNRNETNTQRRIKESQIFILNRRFRDTMNQYNEETLTHRDRCKHLILCELKMGRS
jgi:hypothetical protein